LQQQFAKAYEGKDMAAYVKYKDKYLVLMDDLDKLLATRKDFLLGKWINDAKRYGGSAPEKLLFEQNARNLITTWGDKDCGIHDYAWKQWAGLIKGFYKPRWQQFFNYLEQQAKSGASVDEEAFAKQIKDWEWKWVQGRETYSEIPQGDVIVTVRSMYNKYAKQIK
jgi:alpha-N-acetylglucosaminidase